MTTLFVHGNPETPAVWEPLLAALQSSGDGSERFVCAHLPGFGRLVPEGFGATKEEYASWLTGEVEALVADDGPVDLVGHDWGGGIGMRVVSQRPELFRSWACDVLGLFHPDYVWHDFAQIWQTPGAGEEYFEQQLAAPAEDRIALYEGIGIPRATGEKLVAASDEEMGRCVLALYRSAAQPAMVEWGTRARPGSARCRDSRSSPRTTRSCARSTSPARSPSPLGATIVTMEDQGHWWMLGDPAQGAAKLREFWSSLPGT